MSCIPSQRVVCLVRLSVWSVFTRFSRWHAVRNTFSLQPFPPAKAISAGLAILLGVCILFRFTRDVFCDTYRLHQAIKDISASYNLG
jgi:hypothetical protein